MSEVVVTNLQEILQAINKTADEIMQGAQIGIGRAGLAVERQAKLNANTGTRKYKIRKSKKTGNPWLDISPKQHIGASGKGPVSYTHLRAHETREALWLWIL